MRTQIVSVLVLLFSFSLHARQTTPTSLTFEFNKVVQVQGQERAVAFHSIVFIDAEAEPIGEFIFGTAQANAAQGTGWFGNLTSQTEGTYQWAGTADKQASVTVDVPSNAEGMLLRINAIEDTVWMTVKVGSQVAAQFRVDAYWHSSYVPLGPASPVQKPATVPVWTEGMYFPVFPATDRVYVIKVATRMDDYQFAYGSTFRLNQSYDDMMTLSLISMQGIINRYKPSVYIEWDNYASRLWREELALGVETVEMQLDGMTAMNFLMRKYGDWFSGAVVYNANVGELINLATMQAGLEDRVILSLEQREYPGMPEFSSYLDLWTMAEQQSWDTTEAGRLRMYQWVYENLWPQMEHRIVGVISAGAPTSGSVNVNQFFPLSLGGRDYLIALKLTALSLDVNTPEQAELMSQFLDDAPSPIPVLGTIGLTEFPMTNLVTAHGDWMGALLWPGELFTGGNMTLFARTDVQAVPYESEINQERILASLKGLPVAALYTTDGDALFYDYDHGFRNNIGWADVRGQRAGWSINPTLANLAPVLWNNYVRTRAGSSLICAVSGAGYIYPWLMDDEQIATYLDYTSTYLQQTGMRIIHIFEDLTTGFWAENYGWKYASALQDADYLGAILGYGHNVERGLGFYYTGSPAATVRTGYRLNSTTVSDIVGDLAARNPGEESYDLSGFLSPGCEFVADPEAVGGMTIHVPTSFFGSPSYSMVTSVGPMTLAPGHYQVTFRMKVASNTSASPIAQVQLLYVGALNLPGGNSLAKKLIRPNEFAAAGQYEEIMFEFTLDTLTTELRYWIDYGDGATDLYIDEVRSVNLDGAELPVAAMVVIDNINPHDSNLDTSPAVFAEQFAAQGGLVLTPDELMASLNPEYMLELAKQRLGTNQDIVDAENLLNQGKYLESLLMSRTTLKAIPTGAVREPQLAPAAFRLYQSYPNPFNPSTTIQFDVPTEQFVTLKVFNLLGEEVATPVHKRLSTGSHRIEWNANGLPSGVYVYRLEAGSFVGTEKMVLLK